MAAGRMSPWRRPPKQDRSGGCPQCCAMLKEWCEVEAAGESAWDLSLSLGALSARARLRTEIQSVIVVILLSTHEWSFSEKSAPDERLIPQTAFSAPPRTGWQLPQGPHQRRQARDGRTGQGTCDVSRTLLPGPGGVSRSAIAGRMTGRCTPESNWAQRASAQRRSVYGAAGSHTRAGILRSGKRSGRSTSC